MSKLLRQNVGGTDYTMVGCTLRGVCTSAADAYEKVVTLVDGDTVDDGMTVVVSFTNGNTAGTAPASKIIYSSDQVTYWADEQLTVPFELPPANCYDIEYTGTGNAYSFISYPVLYINGSNALPLCDASGKKASGALWLAKDKVSININIGEGIARVISQTTSTMTVTASSASVYGAPIRVGSTVRVLFTQDLAGAVNTGLILTYNGVGIPVMVGKNGSLGALLPFDVGGSVYKYLQAYTTLEMTYNGAQFIVLGNPAVISNADYTVYTDGSIKYNGISKNNILSFAQAMEFTSTILDGQKYYGATPTSAGTFLVIATFLYVDWRKFYIGVLQIYDNGTSVQKQLTDIHAVGVSATIDEDSNISFSTQPSSLKYLRIGYWNTQLY